MNEYVYPGLILFLIYNGLIINQTDEINVTCDTRIFFCIFRFIIIISDIRIIIISDIP